MEWLRGAIRDAFGRLYEVIANAISTLLSTLLGWLQTIINGIASLFKLLFETLYKIVEYIINFVSDGFKYLYDLFLGEEGFVWYIVDYGISLVTGLIDSFPSVGDILKQYDGVFGTMAALIGRFDQFVPVTEAYWLLTIFLGFKLVIIVARLIMKIIPGIGG